MSAMCSLSIFKHFSKIITIEDGAINGGLGSAIAEFMSDHKYQANLVRLGIPDKFIEHGSQEQLFAECNLSKEQIAQLIYQMAKES